MGQWRVPVVGTRCCKIGTQICEDSFPRMTWIRRSRYPRVFSRIYPWVPAIDPDSCSALLARLHAYGVPAPIAVWDGWRHPSKAEVAHLHQIMDHEETRAAAQTTRDVHEAVHQWGMDAPSWLLAGQDDIVEFLTHCPCQAAETSRYMSTHTVNLPAYMELASPPAPIAVASLSGNPVEPTHRASLNGHRDVCQRRSCTIDDGAGEWPQHGNNYNDHSCHHCPCHRNGHCWGHPWINVYSLCLYGTSSSYLPLSLFFLFCFLSLCSILLVLYLGDHASVWKGGVWGSCKVYGLCLFDYACLLCWHHHVNLMPTCMYILRVLYLFRVETLLVLN